MSRTVFITGAGQGLGLALTEIFLEAGCNVFAGYYEHSNRLIDLEAIYPELKPVCCDVTDPKSVAVAAREVSNHTKQVDVLINNAGIHRDDRSFNNLESVDFGEIRETFEVNTLGPLQVVKHFIVLLDKGERKLIVNISSDAGSISDCWRKNEFGYCMSKAALNMQSKILQNYLGPKGYKILALHPGWMRTAMGGSNAAIDPREAAEGIAKLVEKKWDPTEGIYFDYLEKPMNW